MSRPAKFTHRPTFDGHEQQRRKELGKLLRRARREAGLTQGAVARTLGYAQEGRISQIEHAVGFLEPIELENLAHLYGKSLAHFATWREDQPGTEELRRRAKHNQQEALEFHRRYYKKQK